MRIAYLILAHNTPNHLSRLVRALDSPNVAFFIHVDRKSDISSFHKKLSPRTVTFLQDRVAVYWGDFSDVEATLKLIEAALDGFPGVDYLCLLSGSDYPLRSPQYIEEFFARDREQQFINLVQVPCEALGKPLQRLQQYWLKTPYNNRLLIRLVARLNEVNMKVAFLKRDYSRTFGGLIPYAGSQWWALTKDACQHIVEFVDSRPNVVKYFKNTYLPDESFFHTIIGNSGFVKHVVRNLTFADWSRPDGGPALIDMDHLQKFLMPEGLIETCAYGCGELLFARKFPDDSSQLTDFIDTYLINRVTEISAGRNLLVAL